MVSMKFLVVLFLLVVNFRSFEIPIFKYEGTHYDVFKAVGSKFHKQIRNFIDNYKVINDTLMPFYLNHRNKYDQLVSVIKNKLPQYYDEIRGLSDGSEIALTLITLLQIRAEVVAFMETQRGSEIVPEEDCTDIHVSYENSHFAGHNEDGSELNRELAYFINVNIVEEGYENEKYISYCYPGVLPGIAFGWTASRLLISGNAVTPTFVNFNGVPKVLVYRIGMSGKSIDDTIMKIVNLKERAFGLNLNVGDLDSGRQVLIETAPYDVAIKEVLNTNFSHTNNYKMLNIPYVESVSSTHRQKRIDEFDEPKNGDDILKILGDTKDKEYPLFRESKSGTSTLCSVLYDFKMKKALVFTGNPKITKATQVFDVGNI